MTIEEIPNIEHCDVSMPTSRRYVLRAHEGWYIHINDGDEETANMWKTVTSLMVGQDFSQVEIRAEADLPPDAEICGGDDNEHKVM
jgi:hypothetical protein